MFNKYLTIENSKKIDGTIITQIINELISLGTENKNILFIRTPTTGGWLDPILKK